MKEFNSVKYYDVKEVAERIGVTTRTINRYQEKFDVHPTFIGQQKYFTEENIQQIIDNLIKTPWRVFEN